ncbi:signal peptide peptidase SppA [Sinimarinibacterium sp. NLF-5-8]|uniref:signal peptide peptidase SppA n=1 Tax=Sinimarinibacterium sp. NLF-5-8 TaxID=2698684 RepID=UPI00137BA1A6|nr:signal peptide peptidase SppA [Sinimarinibacterium sp. NLF-5-8]QHS08783.1 signal peptide peptidase SppA [Sinimarinibacterium sp. NLF-5-8]
MSKSRSALTRGFDKLWRIVVVFYKVLIIFSVLISLGMMWFIFSSNKPQPLESNLALVLAPTGMLVEQVDQDPGAKLFEQLNGEQPSQSGLRDLIEALHRAASDARIALAVLKLDSLQGAGLAQLDELREAMAAFQRSGKRIEAWQPRYDQMQYYAAAQADTIGVDPYGEVSVEGFSSYPNFFRDALDKLGVTMHVFRVGQFKSAVEPFTRNDMSAEARSANQKWLNDLWSLYGQAVGQREALSDDSARQYVQGLRAGLQLNGGDGAAYAREQHLVDRLETQNQMRQRLGEVVGIDETHGSFRQVFYTDYLNASQPSRSVPASARKVALIVVQGEIVDGVGEPGQAGGDTLRDLLDDARRDQDVAAVVLRIDSPGGSVWASEQIRRAVIALKQAGKPVVASMSSVAASGGYWVAMEADQIWAHPTTITGSIGVFGIVPTLEKSLEKIGVHTDGVGTTSLAGAFRLDRPLSDEAGAIIQASVEKIYRDFTQGVAAARKLPIEQVQQIAQGRVWSGQDAKALGLVDSFGSLQDAADAAAALADLGAEYQLDERQATPSLLHMILSEFFGRAARSALLPKGWANLFDQVRARVTVDGLLSGLNDPRSLYARCFCQLDGAGRF